ncbi:MAG: phosphatidylserine decarboxylase [Aquihabitans sp.]
MKFDRDGLPFVGLAAVPSALAMLRRRPRWALALLALPAAVGLFFRDPDRQPDHGPIIDPDVVLAPADGKIMHVGEPQPGVAPPGEWQQIVTFLSVADVHINRSPYAGEVTEISYRPGRFLAAFTPESGVENERSEIWLRREVDGSERVVVFRQIVGLLARRVVTRLGVGETVTTGQRMGLMKFGSRMDVFVPPEVEIKVIVGDRTVAGETIIARWPVAGTSA